MSARPIAFAAIGDAEDPGTWSGTPYHFLLAARAEGLAIDGLRFDLTAARGRARRIGWAARRLLALRPPRGMQYDDGFLRALWRSTPPPPPGSVLMNCAQLFPSDIAADPRYTRTFFLDQTLTQLFDYYGHAAHVAPDIRRDAIARETAQYREAAAVILQSRWAAREVIDRYGIDPARVHVVIPGANLDPAALAARDAAHAAPRTARAGPLRVGFVGKDWERKGLDRMIRALALVRATGADAVLQVIGLDPATLPAALRDAAGVEWLGFVDKRRDPARFLRLLDGFDVGCLLSRREAGGIALLEFARLGIPTLAPDTGGAPEYTVPGATTLIAPDAPDEAVAAAVLALAGDAPAFAAQRGQAWDRRMDADWRRGAREVRAILQPGERE